MPKKPQLPPQRPQLRLTGSIHTQVYKDGRIIMRKWPRKRPGPGTPAQQANRFLTGWVWWATKFRIPPEQDAAATLAPKTMYVPRDLLEMATFGRLIQVNASNGVTWYGVKLLTSQVQALLDQLGTTVGTIITRTGDGWDIVLPGDAGQVLTTHGNNTIPSWETVGGSGGGAGWTLLATGAADGATLLASPPLTGDGAIKLLIPNLTVTTSAQPRLACAPTSTTWPTATDNEYFTNSVHNSSGANTAKVAQYHFQNTPSTLTNVRFEHVATGPWGNAGSYNHIGQCSYTEQLIGGTDAADERSYLLFEMVASGTPVAITGNYYWLWQPTPVVL